MQIVLEALVALLAAVGLLSLGWMLFGRILVPVGGRGGGKVYAVLPADGDGGTLEHDVSGLLWLRGGGLARFTVVIADAGLSEEGRAVAAILAERDAAVEVCTAEGLAGRITAK